MYKDHAKVSSIRYAQPEISSDGTFFNPQGHWTPKIDAENPAYDSMSKPFSLSQFIYVRPPIDIGLLTDKPDCGINVLRMPIKFPGTEYRVSKSVGPLWELIRRIAEYEAFINPKHAETFCHITFDKSVVSKGEYHRFPGFHGDGIQGTKLSPKVVVEHSYIVSGSPPTEFCLQPFFLKHLDESKHNYFLEFDKQAKEENIYRILPNHLYLIDPYMVHRTPKITKKAERVFFRMTYAFNELQHPKNTINPMFSGQQYDKRADIRENLAPFEFEVPFFLYGLQQ